MEDVLIHQPRLALLLCGPNREYDRGQSEESEGHAERDGERVVFLIVGGHRVVASRRDQRRGGVVKVAYVHAGDRADTLAVAELGVGGFDGILGFFVGVSVEVKVPGTLVQHRRGGRVHGIDERQSGAGERKELAHLLRGPAGLVLGLVEVAHNALDVRDEHLRRDFLHGDLGKSALRGRVGGLSLDDLTLALLEEREDFFVRLGVPREGIAVIVSGAGAEVLASLVREHEL